MARESAYVPIAPQNCANGGVPQQSNRHKEDSGFGLSLLPKARDLSLMPEVSSMNGGQDANTLVAGRGFCICASEGTRTLMAYATRS